MQLGIAFHTKYKQYDFGPTHPFRGDRFSNAIAFFEKQGLFKLPNVMLLTPEIVKMKDLLRVHNKGYIDLIFDFAKRGRPYDLDTPTSPSILEAALYIMGGALKVGESLAQGEIERGLSLGGGLHHAGESFGGGFCLFNDVAILARSLQQDYGMKRVLILDYDVHAGNGTSDIFYSDSSVLFISIHQDPKTLFPGTGFIDQIGKGEGEGYNVNIPLPPGTSNRNYFYALREVFIPLAKEFKPDIVLANGGSDPHFADILGGLSLTVQGFYNLSRLIVEVAEKACQGKLILLVGSGYNPAVLPKCWYSLAAGLADEESNVSDDTDPPAEPPWCQKRIEETVNKLKRVLSAKWNCF